MVHCPFCTAEVPDGSDRCGACAADLASLIPAAGAAPEEMVDLLKTSDLAFLAVIKTVLSSAQIPFTVHGEEGLRTFSLSVAGGFFNPSAFAAVVRVKARDYADALQLLTPPADPPAWEE